jgi:hypothetical protein
LQARIQRRICWQHYEHLDGIWGRLSHQYGFVALGFVEVHELHDIGTGLQFVEALECYLRLSQRFENGLVGVALVSLARCHCGRDERLRIESQQIYSSQHSFRDNARVPHEAILRDGYAQRSHPIRLP